MDLEHSASRDERYDHVIQAAATLQQLPYLVVSSWWGLMLAPWLSAPPRHAQPEPHEQLVVPEPLEESGEHALFA